MIIKQLKLSNFRKFENQEFRFHDKFNVMIGDNSSGKTQVLEAISIALYSYLLDMEVKSPRHIERKDVRLVSTINNEIANAEETFPVVVAAKLLYMGQEYEISREVTKSGGRTTRINAKSLANRGYHDLSKVRSKNEVNLPILSFYGTSRTWHMKRHTEKLKVESRILGYKNCLDPMSDHLDFQNWFKKYELVSLQKGIEVPALNAVKTAVSNMIPECNLFYFDVQFDKIMLKLNGVELCPFDNLSDGFRNMVAMIADIAYRAAVLNPHLGRDVLSVVRGVVLIDEIDLHLHPTWQRSVVDDLKKTFPKIQFITTTHSPFIIQSLEPGEVIDLNNINTHENHSDRGDYGSPAPDAEYVNKSIEDIAEDVMGVDVPQRSKRLTEMKEAAKEYYQLLENATSKDAEDLERLKDRLDEIMALYSDNMAYHGILEAERVSKGIGRSREDAPDETH